MDKKRLPAKTDSVEQIRQRAELIKLYAWQILNYLNLLYFVEGEEYDEYEKRILSFIEGIEEELNGIKDLLI